MSLIECSICYNPITALLKVYDGVDGLRALVTNLKSNYASFYVVIAYKTLCVGVKSTIFSPEHSRINVHNTCTPYNMEIFSEVPQP